MANIVTEMTHLNKLRGDLVSNLTEKGVLSSPLDTLDVLVPRVLEISGGSSDGNAQFETGTFTPSGSSRTTVDMAFTPDIVSIYCEQPDTTGEVAAIGMLWGDRLAPTTGYAGVPKMYVLLSYYSTTANWRTAFEVNNAIGTNSFSVPAIVIANYANRVWRYNAYKII